MGAGHKLVDPEVGLRVKKNRDSRVLFKISSVLEIASMEERYYFEISPSGYGIHWPLLDEDISIDGLLGIVHAPQWKKKIA